MRLPKTDRPARAGALLIALATACVVAGCAAPGLGQPPATLSSAGHGPQSAEKVQRQCEEHRGVIASYVGEMAKWQVASEKEVAAPAPTLSRALERMFGSSESGIAAKEQLDLRRAKIAGLNGQLTALGCAPVDVETAVVAKMAFNKADELKAELAKAEAIKADLAKAEAAKAAKAKAVKTSAQ